MLAQTVCTLHCNVMGYCRAVWRASFSQHMNHMLCILMQQLERDVGRIVSGAGAQGCLERVAEVRSALWVGAAVQAVFAEYSSAGCLAWPRSS